MKEKQIKFLAFSLGFIFLQSCEVQDSKVKVLDKILPPKENTSALNQITSDKVKVLMEIERENPKGIGNRAEAQRLSDQALSAHQKKDFDLAIDLWFQGSKQDPSWAQTYLNLACASAQLNKKSDALAFLGMGFRRDKDYILNNLSDKDLDPIRSSSEFIDLVKLFPPTMPEELSSEEISGYWSLEMNPMQLILWKDGTFSFTKYFNYWGIAWGIWSYDSTSGMISLHGKHRGDNTDGVVRDPSDFHLELTYDPQGPTIKYIDSDRAVELQKLGPAEGRTIP